MILGDGTVVLYRGPVLYIGSMGTHIVNLVGVFTNRDGREHPVVNFDHKVCSGVKARVIDGIKYENTWICSSTHLKQI